MKCDNCENEACHQIWKKEFKQELCCKCYVEEGNPPADWHWLCMETDKRIRGYPTEKFENGSFVQTILGDIGVIQYSYAKKYGGNNVKDYSLIFITESGEIIGSSAWHHEGSLEKLDYPIKEGLEIIKKYEANKR